MAALSFITTLLLLLFMLNSSYQHAHANIEREMYKAKEMERISNLMIPYFRGDNGKEFLETFWNSGIYNNLYFVYKNGNVLFDTPSEDPKLLSLDMRTRMWYQCARKTGGSCLSDIYINLFYPHEEMITYSYPVYRDGIFFGVGAFDLPIKKISESVVSGLSISDVGFDGAEYKVYFKINSNMLVHSLALFSAFFMMLVASYLLYLRVIKARIGRYKYDGLTGILRRDSFKVNKINDKVKCFCLLDIDNFKYINDTYGHDIGDRVIRSIAQCIKTTMRRQDVLFRWGGEEFLVILRADSNTDIEIEAIMERLRSTIEHLVTDGVPSFTVSIGYYVFCIDDIANEAIKKADIALYAAKRAGRNQVVCYYPALDAQLAKVAAL